MVGPIDNQEKIRRALKVFILKEREKERRDEELEVEKMRKKKEQDERKLKEEEECKFIKTKLTELSKKRDKLQQDKNKILDHLKKVREDAKHPIQIEDLTKLYNMGVAVTHVSNAPSSSVYPVTAPVTIVPRVSAVSVVNSPCKTTVPTSAPVHPMPAQKRNRSPSPTIFHRSPYSYKVPAGPHPFQKLEDSHRNHEYNRSYLYSTKQGSAPPSSNYGAFYPPAQSVVYTHPSPAVHSNAPVYSSYGVNPNRDSVEVLHKPQPHSQTPPQHSSLYPSHRSSLSGSSPSIQSSNHVSYLVDHAKSGPPYPDDKYYLMRPSAQMTVHGNVIPIQPPPPQVSNHGSITSGFPVRPPSTQIGGPPPMHIQPSHTAGHLGSQSSHHPSHHSPQTHHPGSQQSPVTHHQGPSHHPPSTVHYPPPPPPHTQSQLHHSSQPPPSITVPSHHHQPPPHIQQLHVQSHHPLPPGSHHQIISHHASPSIHHSSSQQHLQQAIHHQQALQQSQSHHPMSHSQSLHHQPHIQQHILSQAQQSQPTSVVTSQAYVNQLNEMQGGSRMVYNHSHPPPH